MKTCSDKVVV